MITSEVIKIGHEIRENSHILTRELVDRDPSAKPICSVCQLFIIEKFFECVGEALCRDDHAASLRMIAEWAINSRHHYSQAHMRSQPVNFPSQGFREVLLDFIEIPISNSALSAHEIIDFTKKICFYIDHAANLFKSPSNHKLIKDIEDGNILTNDELITLKELTSLKNALKEATILSITDSFDRITYANEMFCNITKYSIEELYGKTHNELFYSGMHGDDFFAEIKKFVKEGKVWRGEICNKAKDGSLYWVDTTVVPFFNNKGVPYEHISIMYDITEKKQTEDMLNKSEKLSLVGELAAGFAHEIRNPLTTIRGFVQIMDSFTDEKRKRYSQTILDEIDRINTIVSEFMVLARPHAVNFSRCNLRQIIKNVVNFLGSEATMKNVEITHTFLEEEIYIHGERHQLTQVFINLIKNAMDALPKGGRIDLSYTIKNNEICVAVKDNGIGMTLEQIKKIGQPFFTTKEKGNGLGLMVSYKIITNHRGQINVTSEKNKGTTFFVTFPLLLED